MEKAKIQASFNHEKVEKLTTQLKEMQADEGAMNTASERELTRDNNRLNDELKQQVKVNKTLSNKILICEK